VVASRPKNRSTASLGPFAGIGDGGAVVRSGCGRPGTGLDVGRRPVFSSRVM
jgi:hypothetical protein